MTPRPGSADLGLRAGVAIGALLAAAGAVWSAGAAAAEWVLLDSSPGLLEVYWGDGSPRAVEDYVPGEVVHWQLRAALEGADEGEFTLEIRAEGGLVGVDDGLMIEVRTCPGQFDGDPPDCAAGAEQVLGWQPVTAVATSHGGGLWSLAPLRTLEDRYFLISVGTDADASSAPELAGESAVLRLGLSAAGVSPTSIGTLSDTGTESGGAVLLGAALTGGGVLLALLAALLRRRRDDRPVIGAAS